MQLEYSDYITLSGDWLPWYTAHVAVTTLNSIADSAVAANHCNTVTRAEYGLASVADFALAFWMVHEVPDKEPSN